MGETTKISWTDSTWNPVYGCSEVSPGCDNCYAKRQMARYGKPWKVTCAAPDTFYAPLKWRKPRRILTCSWGDLFYPQVREETLQGIWDIMLTTPQHTYLILTKRPGRMAWWAQTHPWPDHIWAGTSVESAKYLPRLDVLARVPAKVRFASFEPLLGPVDIDPYFYSCSCGQQPCICKGLALQWAIVGGESGPIHRLMEVAWVQNIADSCDKAGVPLFVKQASSFLPGEQGNLPGALWARKELPCQTS